MSIYPYRFDNHPRSQFSFDFYYPFETYYKFKHLFASPKN